MATMPIEEVYEMLGFRDLNPSISGPIMALLNANYPNGIVDVNSYAQGQSLPANAMLVVAESDFTVPPDAGQILFMSEGAHANAVFDASNPLEYIFLGKPGDNNMQFLAERDMSVSIQGGDIQNVIATSSGNDIIFTQGDRSLVLDTGAGDDYIRFGSSEAQITSGSGNSQFISATSYAGHAEINAGAGFDMAALRNGATRDASAVGWNGESQVFQITGHEADWVLNDVNVLYFADRSHTDIQEVSVLADNVADSLVAKLYQVAFNRQMDAGEDRPEQMGGLKFWETEFDQGEGFAGLQHTVYSFLNCAEFAENYAGVDNTAYVAKLFANLGVDAAGAIGGKSIADYVAQIGNGDNYARYDVAWEIAASNDVVNILGSTGSKYVIDGGFAMIGPDGATVA